MNRHKKKTASEWRGPFEIQLLPPDIIIDILSWLPVKTVLSCKCVCKDWHRLISHPRFVELQLARSSPAILVKTITCKISFTHVEQSGRAHYRLHRLAPPKSNLPNPRFRLVNSCNGLLCLSGNEKQGPIWVCNPILGEYITIPSASKGRDWGSFIALGFCAVANRYKLLQTFNPKVKGSWNCFPDAEIYDMDTGTWRSIGRAPCGSVILPFNSLLRGCLHWVSSSGVGAEYIYSFNFEKEEFGSVPPPPCLDLDETQRQSFNKVTLRLGVVEGCLFLCVTKNDSPIFHIWVMKDYGVKESWTKQYVIQTIRYPGDFHEPINFLNNGDILMWYNCWEVVCYNTQSKSFRGTSITRTRHHFESTAHTPSLVSLYHVTKGELVKSTLEQYAEVSDATRIAYALSVLTESYRSRHDAIKEMIVEVPSTTIREVIAELFKIDEISNDLELHARCCNLMLHKSAREKFVALRGVEDKLNWLRYAAYNPQNFIKD